MFGSLLLAAAFQVGPFYEQGPDAAALRPLWSAEGQTTDVVWPLFTSHRDWWRFLFLAHGQSNDRGWQFDLLPLFWLGRAEERRYGGLFPLYGSHPHALFMHDVRFALWPLWMRYDMPRAAPREDATAPCEMMTTRSVLWPFIHWRDDGSWGLWPLYVCNRQRESFHRAALWPVATWARYERDRDTAGAGSSWMLWPLCGGVTREREDQWLFLPPFFSRAETRPPRRCAANSERGVRLRCPWPLVEFEATARRDRLSLFPFYERTVQRSYASKPSSEVTARFGWKLVELYPDETRVFPFWVSRADGSYFRLWPFWESKRGEDGVTRARFLSLFPVRNVPAVDRNWAKFWTLYERAEAETLVRHSLFWGLLRWETERGG